MDNDIFTEMNLVNLEIIRLFSKLDANIDESCLKLMEKNVVLRKKIRELSEKTEVPIEPQEVSEFLDKIMSISDEVIFGIVPGGILYNNVIAGGYDALVVLSYGEITNNKLLALVEEYRRLKNNSIQCVEVNFTKRKGTLFEVN